MTLTTPLWMQPGVGDPDIDYSAGNDRLLIEQILSEGVIGTNALKVSQRGAGANMSVDIAVGAVAITGDDAAGQGRYLMASTATENRTIPGPPGAGSRTHRVVARVKDTLHNIAWGGDYEWDLEVLEDTGSGTPAVPNSTIGLARVTVTSTDTSITNAMITDDRVQAGFAGVSGKASKLLDSDDGAITNNVTPANSGLFVTLAAGLVYEIRCTLIYSAATAGDLKIDFTGPTGFGCDLSVNGLAASAGGTTGDDEHALLLASPNTVTLGGAGVGTKVTAYLHGHLYSGVGGTLRLRTAQGTSNAGATVLHGKSLLIADPF